MQIQKTKVNKEVKVKTGNQSNEPQSMIRIDYIKRTIDRDKLDELLGLMKRLGDSPIFLPLSKEEQDENIISIWHCGFNGEVKIAGRFHQNRNMGIFCTVLVAMLNAEVEKIDLSGITIEDLAVYKDSSIRLFRLHHVVLKDSAANRMIKSSHSWSLGKLLVYLYTGQTFKSTDEFKKRAKFEEFVRVYRLPDNVSSIAEMLLEEDSSSQVSIQDLCSEDLIYKVLVASPALFEAIPENVREQIKKVQSRRLLVRPMTNLQKGEARFTMKSAPINKNSRRSKNYKTEIYDKLKSEEIYSRRHHQIKPPGDGWFGSVLKVFGCFSDR